MSEISEHATPAPDPLIETVRQHQLNEFRHAHHFILKILAIHWLLASTLVGALHGTFITGFVVGGLLFAVVWLASRLLPANSAFLQGGMGVTLLGYSMLFIQQSQGMTEMHFHVFCALAFLLRYKSLIPLFSAAAAIIAYYLLGAILQQSDISLLGQPIAVYTGNANVFQAGLHILFVLAETAILGHVIRALFDSTYADLRAHHATRQALHSVNTLLLETSQGQFRTIEDDELPGEFAELKSRVNDNIHALSAQSGHIHHNAAALYETADAMSQHSAHLADSLHTQSGQTQQLGRLLHGLHESLQHTLVNVQHTAQIAAQAQAQAQQGQQVLGQTRAAIDDIRGASDDIHALVHQIEQLASQANLLALNASVETASFGSRGKGFDDICHEVQSLAQRSADAVKDISRQFHHSHQRIQHGQTLLDQSGTALTRIMDRFGEVRDNAQALDQAAQQQGEQLAEVHQGLTALTDSVTHSGQIVAQTRQISQNTREQVQQLDTLIQSTFSLPSRQEPDAEEAEEAEAPEAPEEAEEREASEAAEAETEADRQTEEEERAASDSQDLEEQVPEQPGPEHDAPAPPAEDAPAPETPAPDTPQRKPGQAPD